jgi:hypothetical protein
LLRINSFSPYQNMGIFGGAQNGGYAPVDLNRFLQTGDVFGSAGGQFGQQDFLQMMQMQMLAQLLMAIDPMMLAQMIMSNMMQGQQNGGAGGAGGCGCNRGRIQNGGFSNRRQTQPWGHRSEPSGHRPGGHEHSRTDGPRSQNQRGIPDGLRQNAANGARVVREMGFTGTIGGLGHRSGPSDHPHGNAIDVMTNSDTRMGRQVAEHFRQNHDQLGVKYVIYQQQIASPRTGWQWERMRDRGSPTANHMDHPHISFY